MLVGYGEETKGYRLFDPEHGGVIFIRDVIFNEECCGSTGVGGSGVGDTGVGGTGVGGSGVGGLGVGSLGVDGLGVGGTDQYMELDFDDT